MPTHKITLKQRKFIKAFIANKGDATAAAKEAGYNASSNGSFAVIGFHNLAKLSGKIKAIMEQMGLDDLSLLRKLDEGLNAMEVKTASDKGIITDEK